MTSTLRAAAVWAAVGLYPGAGAAQLASLKAPVPVGEESPVVAASHEQVLPVAGAEPPAERAGPPREVTGSPVAPEAATVLPGPSSVPTTLYGDPAAEYLSARPAGPWCLVAPYGWVFGMKGTVGVRNRTAEVDLSVRDAVTHLLPDLKGAAQLHVEGGYGPVGVLADLTYLNVEPLDRQITVESRSTLLELMGTYRLVDQGGWLGGVSVDLLAGARYYRFANSITLNPVDLTPVDRSNSWVDAVVGARAAVRLTDRLGVFGRADFGGFGWGNSSQQATNLIAGFEYRCGECCSLTAGYRWFKINREDGTGRDRFLLDATLSGPFVALGFRF